MTRPNDWGLLGAGAAAVPQTPLIPHLVDECVVRRAHALQEQVMAAQALAVALRAGDGARTEARRGLGWRGGAWWQRARTRGWTGHFQHRRLAWVFPRSHVHAGTLPATRAPATLSPTSSRPTACRCLTPLHLQEEHGHWQQPPQHVCKAVAQLRCKVVVVAACSATQ